MSKKDWITECEARLKMRISKRYFTTRFVTNVNDKEELKKALETVKEKYPNSDLLGVSILL